ncbi:MAG: dihydropteroate synthase [bacterium]|nr:dihydropteroate synthase [bacterium]
MGILNCTPDSFSDGGRYMSVNDATHRGYELAREGATIIDIGGESTRPGAKSVSVSEETARVIPVVTHLRAKLPETVLSIDTTKPEVARAAIDAGADIVNDVSAGCDQKLLSHIKRAEAALILMHMRGTPRTMQMDTRYRHVVGEVHGFLRECAKIALDAGIPRQSIWLDPGIGFGKDDGGNLKLLRSLPELGATGHPVVIGASRKSYIGRLTDAETEHRLPGSLASLLPALECPAAVVRVHDVSETVQFLAIASHLTRIAG